MWVKKLAEITAYCRVYKIKAFSCFTFVVKILKGLPFLKSGYLFIKYEIFKNKYNKGQFLGGVWVINIFLYKIAIYIIDLFLGKFMFKENLVHQQ